MEANNSDSKRRSYTCTRMNYCGKKKRKKQRLHEITERKITVSLLRHAITNLCVFYDVTENAAVSWRCPANLQHGGRGWL